MRKAESNFNGIEIEEFKYIADRKKEYENRSIQMLFFCITSYGVIYGFSGKIPEEILPYLLSFALLITSKSGAHHHVLQNFTSAYVAIKYYSESNDIGYESMYNHWTKRNSRTGLFSKWMTIARFLIEPFFLLFLVSLTSSIYYSEAVINKNYGVLLEVLYFIGLLSIHILILAIQIRRYQLDYFYFENYFKNLKSNKV